MKTYLLMLATVFSTACSAGGGDYAGNYKRQGASDFEVAHNMNTSVTIEKQQGKQYLVTLHSGYGNVMSVGQADDKQLLINDDLVITKKGDKLNMSYVDNPEVVFTFKAEK